MEGNFAYFGKEHDGLPIKTTSTPDSKQHGKLKSLEESISYSEALERTEHGIFNYLVIIVTSLVWANVSFETTAAAFYMPVAHCDLQLTNYRKGLLSAIGFVGIVVSSHLWGFLADTTGRRRVIQPTLIAGFVVTVISSFAINFWWMLVLRLINGIFISGASASIFAYIGEFHTDRRRSQVMMIASFIFCIASMAMPFQAFAVINREWRLTITFMGLVYKPWRLYVIVCGIPGLISGIAMYYLPESPKFLLSINKEGATKEVLQQMYRINGGKGKLEIPHLISEEDYTANVDDQTETSNIILKFLANMWNQTMPLFQKKYLRTTAIICITQFWLFVIANGLYMWFPYIINAMVEFLKHNPGTNQALCAIVQNKHETLDDNSTLNNCPDKLENTTYMYSLLVEILYVSLFAIVTVIVNRVSKIAMMVTIVVFCSSCGLAAVWVPYISISAIFYVILFPIGSAVSILGAATVDLYPTQLRAMAMCISLMMGRIGAVMGTSIVGALVDNNCEMTFYITCFAMMSCAFLLLFLPRTNISSEKSSEAASDISPTA